MSSRVPAKCAASVSRPPLTLRRVCGKLKPKMRGAKYIAVFIAVAVLLANPLDCLASWMAGGASMECCNKGPCSSIGRDDCCAQMTTGHLPTATVVQASVPPPVCTAAFEVLISGVDRLRLSAEAESSEAHEHGPPNNLYTLHTFLLI